MSDSDLFDAVALKTGGDSHEIRRRGFALTGPHDTGPEPECLLADRPTQEHFRRVGVGGVA